MHLMYTPHSQPGVLLPVKLKAYEDKTFEWVR